MSATYPCPKGHTSAEPDYCDTCGAAISGAPAVPTTPPASPSQQGSPIPAGAPTLCPVCSTPRAGADRFCENDGYDFTTGRRPDPIPPATPTTAGQAIAPPPTAGTHWTVTAEADRDYYDRNDIDDVDFPTICPTRAFTLTRTEIRIGRHSQSKGINPEIDLSGPPLDPGISHLHAVLTATTNGWSLTDPGSTNGTTINDSSEPLDPSATIPIGDGDRIHVGAWTTITLHNQP
jgi:hypothetical protein